MVQKTHVVEGHAAHGAALPTPRWERHLDLFIKTKIIWFNNEVLVTILAIPICLIHDRDVLDAKAHTTSVL